MAAGFRSPLQALGYSSPATVVQGGYKTPIPFVGLGSVTIVSPTQAGFVTPFPFPTLTGGGTDSVVDSYVKGGGRRKKYRGGKAPTAQLIEEGVLEELDTPLEIQEVFEEVLSTGTATVGDMVLQFDDVPKPPVFPDLVATVDVDKEIAELIRAQELQEYEQRLAKYKEDVRTFEEEFVVFLILILDE